MNVAPEVLCPAGGLVAIGEVWPVATATDADGNEEVTLTCTDSDGAAYPPAVETNEGGAYTVTVSCTAVDTSGASASCEFSIEAGALLFMAWRICH